MSKGLRWVPLLVLLSVCAAGAGEIAWKAQVEATRAAGPKAPLQLPDGAILSVREEQTRGNVRLVLARSDARNAREWREVADIAAEAEGTDLGDCHLVRLRDGRLWCAYRRNRYRGGDAARPRYAIEAAESRDDGRTWRKHSLIAEARHEKAPPRSRGLWSSFLLEKRDGVLQCYYDDENAPALSGFAGHQWLMMKTWDPQAQRWGDAVVVSRAHDERHLSRDGMGSVVEMDDGRLLAAYESVDVRPPHANLIRCVSSADGGRTWSWRERERGVIYATKRPNYLALAPWMIRRRDGSLLLVFCTDEDRDEPGVSGTPPPRLRMDIKCLLSRDEGATWSSPQLVYAGGHRNYLPGVVELANRALRVHFDDYAGGGVRIVRGVERP